MRTRSLQELAAGCVSVHGFQEVIPLGVSDRGHGLTLQPPLLSGRSTSKMAALVPFTPGQLQVAWER